MHVLRGRRERRREAEETGAILARLHWQCWREDPPPVEVTDAEFIRVMPQVIRSGSVGLVWPRLRERFDPAGAVALAMEAAFQAQVAHNARVEREIAQVVTRLREHGIEPVLIKGLAVARLYPPGLVRPSGGHRPGGAGGGIRAGRGDRERAGVALGRVGPAGGALLA